jgi:hypothetical protein
MYSNTHWMKVMGRQLLWAGRLIYGAHLIGIRFCVSTAPPGMKLFPRSSGS